MLKHLCIRNKICSFVWTKRIFDETMYKRMNYLCSCAVCAALLLAGCGQTPKGYVIEGKVTNPKLDGRTVYMLDALDPAVRLDSVKVTDGRFRFEGVQDAPEVRELMVQENDSDRFPVTLPFVLENGRIEVDLGDRVYTGNTKLNDEMMDLLMAFDRFYERDFSGQTKEQVETAFADLLMTEIVKHSNSVVGKYIYEGYRGKLSEKQQADARQTLGIKDN